MHRATRIAPGLIAGPNDVAVTREPVQQRGGHLRVQGHAGSLGKCEVAGDECRDRFVALGNEFVQIFVGRRSQGFESEVTDDR